MYGECRVRCVCSVSVCIVVSCGVVDEIALANWSTG